MELTTANRMHALSSPPDAPTASPAVTAVNADRSAIQGLIFDEVDLRCSRDVLTGVIDGSLLADRRNRNAMNHLIST
ncbi:MAG: hypothetical protein JO001_26860 [Alphaproteobacteria bacterium]|nr:hypothetical protein [Alphaproteobacteria bacterium]